jgi:hypothetical protein
LPPCQTLINKNLVLAKVLATVFATCMALALAGKTGEEEIVSFMGNRSHAVVWQAVPLAFDFPGVQWAPDAQAGTIHDVSINLGGRHIYMPE